MITIKGMTDELKKTLLDGLEYPASKTGIKELRRIKKIKGIINASTNEMSFDDDDFHFILQRFESVSWNATDDTIEKVLKLDDIFDEARKKG